MEYNKTFFKEIFKVNTSLEIWVKNNIDAILNDPMLAFIKPYFEDWIIDYSQVNEGKVKIHLDYGLPIIGLFKITASFDQRMFWKMDNSKEIPSQVLHWSSVMYKTDFVEVTVPFSNVHDIRLILYPLIVDELEETFSETETIKSLDTVVDQ